MEFKLAIGVISICLVTMPAVAQQNDQETNPQTSASTTVKQPAGVSTPAVQGDTQGVKGAETDCKSASAEMTNGAVESCKK